MDEFPSPIFRFQLSYDIVESVKTVTKEWEINMDIKLIAIDIDGT